MQGIKLPNLKEIKFDLLKEESEDILIRKLLDLPDEIAYAALNLEPHRLPVYALDLAGIFHAFYGNCRVLGVEKDLQIARLALCKASALCIARALTLIGVASPAHM